jgi:sterol desaturase/sphingolipid hydroxylase (fatty acid hydroxylase superfamily)
MLGSIALLLYLERTRPLRKPVDPGLARLARNVAIAAVTVASVSAIERPLVTRCARLAEERSWGVLPKIGMPAWLRLPAAVALMDYTLYWWHVLLHRVPLLWRMHEPHHIDLDLDVSTALRFHFTEFMASVPWRCAQIVSIGVTPGALALWQKLTLLEVLFHHSNWRLPRKLERWLSRLVVTPRLHGIHHSILREERDSNYSSGLSVWDTLHGTARRALSHDDVTIGLPGYQARDAVTLGPTLTLPFQKDAAAEDLAASTRT